MGWKLIGAFAISSFSLFNAPGHASATSRPVASPAYGYDLQVLSSQAQNVYQQTTQFLTAATAAGVYDAALIAAAQQLDAEAMKLANQCNSMASGSIELTLENMRRTYFNLQNAAAGKPGMNATLGQQLLQIGNTLQQMGYYCLPNNPNWGLTTWQGYYSPYWIGLPFWGTIGWGIGWGPWYRPGFGWYRGGWHHGGGWGGDHHHGWGGGGGWGGEHHHGGGWGGGGHHGGHHH